MFQTMTKNKHKVPNLEAKMSSVLSVIAASTDSSIFDPDPNNIKFAISVSFLDFKDLTAFCKLAFKDEVSQYPSRTFWLSWVLFDMTFQSAEFSVDDSDLQKVRDTLRVRCTEEAMIRSATNDSCMRLFLCTQGCVLAAVGMPLSKYTASTATLDSRASNFKFPISSTGWYDLEYSPSLFPIPTTQLNAPSVKVNIIVGIEHESDPALTVRSPVTTSVRSPDDLCDTSSEDGNDTEEGNDDDIDDYTRHYRVNVEVRSIGGLKRAANAAIHFTYPFLGAGGPVRTHPIWLPANSEGNIDNASASYDCCMSRNRLRDILSEHPLKISALSRTHLGTANIGDVTVDLFGVLESRPHSFRCSITNRTFRSKEEYVSHRQSFLALRALGQIDRVPPSVPITIWANDSYFPLTVSNRDKRDRSSDNVIMGGKLRVIIIIEELSIVGTEIATPVRPGYKMHNGALYVVKDPLSLENLDSSGNMAVESHSSEKIPSPLDKVGLSDVERAALEKLTDEWEAYRSSSELQWRSSLKERETAMRSKLDSEASSILAERADDLKRAQEEAGRLEVRLRGAIDEAERQKSQLKLKEEQMQMKLAQKVNELQLLQRRVRDEAKARIDSEVQKNESLISQFNTQKQQSERYEKRINEITKEFDIFRNYSRGTPESVLREEIARVKALLGESRAEVERERRIKSEAELEKGHYRAQMHRLAIALKREREKSTASARQDLDQLRLEFLAREERYVLDGDREELRNIRHELASLRSATHGQSELNQQQQQQQQQQKQQQQRPNSQTIQYQIGVTSPSFSSLPIISRVSPSSFKIRAPPAQLPRTRDPQNNSFHSDDLEVLTSNNDDGSHDDDSSDNSYINDRRNDNDDRNRSKLHDSNDVSNSTNDTKNSLVISYIDEDDEEMPRMSVSPPTPMSFPFPSSSASFEPSNLSVPYRGLGPAQSYPPAPPSQPISTVSSSSSSSNSSCNSPQRHDGGRERRRVGAEASENKNRDDPRETLGYLRKQIADLLQTGMYSDSEDPVIAALNAEISHVEAMIIGLRK